MRSLERLVVECAEELDALRREARPTRAVAAALRQLEMEHEAFDRILGHASDWLSELKGLSDGLTRLATCSSAWSAGRKGQPHVIGAPQPEQR
ncbi:hypothetical protein [Streptomyces sp. NPDC047061]|uniref:hypothetical protein n=1 Tax=Streptomyces sp. NPDC047061 TaxID=3154605 RepID=UPI00340D2E04